MTNLIKGYCVVSDMNIEYFTGTGSRQKAFKEAICQYKNGITNVGVYTYDDTNPDGFSADSTYYDITEILAYVQHRNN